ncbi:MAG: YdbH domain-containing protein [Sphingomonas sp.]
MAEPGEAPEADPLAPTGKPRHARWRRATLVSGTALALVAGGVWISRTHIAQLIVDRELANRQIPATFSVDDLGFNRQRLRNLVIGDPAHPDLVADWVELDTALGFGTATLSGVHAGQVRVRGRLVDGRLSFGTIDTLLPRGAGGAFRLPDLFVAVADGRLRLEAPQGVVGITFRGAGNLANGFRGSAAAITERLMVGDCRAGRSAAQMQIAIVRGEPRLAGPLRAESLTCAGATTRAAKVDARVTLGAGLDRWNGEAAIAASGIVHRFARVAAVSGTVRFSGDAGGTAGAAKLTGQQLVTTALTSDGATYSGDFGIGRSGVRLAGDVGVLQAAISPAWRRQLGQLRRAAPGTPVAPLLARLSVDAEQAAKRFDARAQVRLGDAANPGLAVVRLLTVTSASGVQLGLSGGQGARYRLADGAIGLDGTVTMAGGGLPEGRITLRQRTPGGAISGTGRFAPYAAAGARLALGDAAFTRTPGGATAISAAPLFSGALGDGSITNARLPLTVVWNGRTRLAVNTSCTPLAFDGLRTAGLALSATRLILCPKAGAPLVQIVNGRVHGGAAIASPSLAGRLGGSPLMLTADRANVTFGDTGFSFDNVHAALGSGAKITRIDAATLIGKLGRGNALDGTFGGGGGQIGGVPLIMSSAAGTWRFAGGALRLNGTMALADADPARRFNPLTGRDVVLTLKNEVITATGTFANPETGISVGNARIVHALGAGEGHADLEVPGLVFGDALQPDQLTPLTFGVIANVVGTVRGNGHISWTPNGVTSSGVFRTIGTDLAAAFGPVTGVSTEIRFTDLLNLESAPDQVATVAEINPGIAVSNGVVHYQTLAGQKLKVLSAHWPLAGGALDLDPAELNFDEQQARNLTFRVTGIDSGQFLQQFDFKNLNATGQFDGVLPMIFDAQGGRIANGALKVRPGGGTIAYVGELTQEDLGVWGNFAFQSLKSLKYRSLDVVMNGALAGEVVTDVRFAGISQGQGAKSNFLIRRLQKLPLIFNVRIRAPFRGLLSSVQSFVNPSLLLRDRAQELGLQPIAPATLPAAAKPVQPPESEKLP